MPTSVDQFIRNCVTPVAGGMVAAARVSTGRRKRWATEARAKEKERRDGEGLSSFNFSIAISYSRRPLYTVLTHTRVTAH